MVTEWTPRSLMRKPTCATTLRSSRAANPWRRKRLLRPIRDHMKAQSTMLRLPRCGGTACGTRPEPLATLYTPDASIAPLVRGADGAARRPYRNSTAAACRVVTLLLLMAGFAVAESHTNWPRWRGPLDNGSTEGGTYPVKWDAQSVLWKAPLPGKGCSTPIVWNQRVYLTAPSNGLDAVLAFDWSGKALWHTTLGPEDPGKHRNGSGSNPSPTTDGKSVFVYFKSGTLAALDFNGKVRWQTNLVARF